VFMKSEILSLSTTGVMVDNTSIPNVLMFVPDLSCQWSDWSSCEGTPCIQSSGIQTRERIYSGTPCWGSGQNNTQNCTLTCYCSWSSWSSWSTCQITHQLKCSGIQQHSRSTILPNGASSCVSDNSPSFETTNCVVDCPTCEWSSWSEWSLCVNSGPTNCGQGTQQRLRDYVVLPCLSEDIFGVTESLNCSVPCSTSCQPYTYYIQNYMNSNSWPISMHRKLGCELGYNVTMSTLSFKDILFGRISLPDAWRNLALQYIAGQLNLALGCSYGNSDMDAMIDQYISNARILLQDCNGWYSTQLRKALYLTNILLEFNNRS